MFLPKPGILTTSPTLNLNKPAIVITLYVADAFIALVGMCKLAILPFNV